MSNKYLDKFAAILDSPVVKGVEKVLNIAANFVPFLGIVADFLSVAPGLGDSLKQNQIARDKVYAVNSIIENYRKKLSADKFELLLSAAYSITEYEKNSAKKIHNGASIDRKTCDEILSLYISYGEFNEKFEDEFEKINSNHAFSYVKEELFDFLTDIGSSIMELETEILGTDFKILLKNIEKIGEEQHNVTREIVKDEAEKIQEEMRRIEVTVSTLAGTIGNKNNDEDEPLTKLSINRNRKFVCREEYIKDIGLEFEKKRIVILFGMGGIGKSEIAKAYVNDSDYYCPQIIFINDNLSVSGGLKDVVSSATFTSSTNFNCIALDSEEKQYRYKLQRLSSYNENTLLVFDNYNGISNDNIEDILSNLNCRVLITTRAQYLKINNDLLDKVATIEVKPLSEEELNVLFRKTLNIENADDYCVKNAELLKDVFEKSLRHTMTIKMIAELINENICSLETILQNLGKYNLDFGKNKFEHNNNNKKFTTILGHLKALFECTGMSKEEKDILRQLTLIANDGIMETDFLTALGENDAGVIARLSSLGYIAREPYFSSFKLSMHPLIRESVAAQTQPNNENCNQILSYLYLYCHANSATLYSELLLKKNMASHALDILRKYGSSSDARLSEELVRTLTLLGQTNAVYSEIAKVEERGIFSPELCYKKAVLDYKKFANGEKRLFDAMEKCAERGYYDWAATIGIELISLSSMEELKKSSLSKKVYNYFIKADMPIYATLFNSLIGKKDKHQGIDKKDKVLEYFADFIGMVRSIFNSSRYCESNLFQVAIQCFDDLSSEEKFKGVELFKIILIGLKYISFDRRFLKFFIYEYEEKSKYEAVVKLLLATVLYASPQELVIKWREIVRNSCGHGSKKAILFEECANGLTIEMLSNYMKLVMSELPNVGNYYISKKALLSLYYKMIGIFNSNERNELRRQVIEEQKQNVDKKLSNKEFNTETVDELRILIELMTEDGDFVSAVKYVNILSNICTRCLGYKNDVVVDSCLYMYDIGSGMIGSRVFGINSVIRKAMPLLKDRLDYYEQLYGKDSQQIASYYMDYAYKVLRMDVKAAGEYAKKAWKIFEKSDILDVVSEAQTYCVIMQYVDQKATLDFAREIIKKLTESKVKSIKIKGNICWFLEYIAYRTSDKDEKIRCFRYAVKINTAFHRNKNLMDNYIELAIIYGVEKGDFKTALVYIRHAYSLDCKYKMKGYPYLVDILFRQGKNDFTSSHEFDKLLKHYYKKNKENKQIYSNYAIFREAVMDGYRQKSNENEYDKDYYNSKFIKINAVCKQMIDEFEQYANNDMIFKIKFEHAIINSFVKYSLSQ